MYMYDIGLGLLYYTYRHWVEFCIVADLTGSSDSSGDHEQIQKQFKSRNRPIRSRVTRELRSQASQKQKVSAVHKGSIH